MFWNSIYEVVTVSCFHHSALVLLAVVMNSSGKWDSWRLLLFNWRTITFALWKSGQWKTLENYTISIHRVPSKPILKMEMRRKEEIEWKDVMRVCIEFTKAISIESSNWTQLLAFFRFIRVYSEEYNAFLAFSESIMTIFGYLKEWPIFFGFIPLETSKPRI